MVLKKLGFLEKKQGFASKHGNIVIMWSVP